MSLPGSAYARLCVSAVYMERRLSPVYSCVLNMQVQLPLPAISVIFPERLLLMGDKLSGEECGTEGLVRNGITPPR